MLEVDIGALRAVASRLDAVFELTVKKEGTSKWDWLKAGESFVLTNGKSGVVLEVR